MFNVLDVVCGHLICEVVTVTTADIGGTSTDEFLLGNQSSINISLEDFIVPRVDAVESERHAHLVVRVKGQEEDSRRSSSEDIVTSQHSSIGAGTHRGWAS